MPDAGRGFVAELDAQAGLLRLAGDCRMTDLQELERALAQWHGAGARGIDLSAAGEFDIGPAWLIESALRRGAGNGRPIAATGTVPRHAAYLEQLLAEQDETAGTAADEARRSWLVNFGHALESRFHSWYEAMSFSGQILTTAGGAWKSTHGWRVPSFVRHAYETGVQAVPVVSVIAFLISVISAYIGAQQLRPFGAEIFTVDLVAIGVLRELGVLLTAIMVAGRTGSAYAAEIGVMKLNDEIDALESIGVNPYEVLVLPRVLGLVIALPLLTIVADFMGLAGGGLLARYLLDLPWPQFFSRLDEAIAPTTLWAGLVKAPVFGILIALTGTLRGLQVRNSSRELGRLTTVAVVQSIFLVIFADALFAMFFLEIDF
jgi:phospholipid/cholesterol/gamma-HCH transport system permease protein